ncbi:MAG: glycine cleavage system aminomethyltransferase GcvT [Thermoprotei archaeon]|nr:MAG: glycine cleavage system aminomethyltransferase GcvT [Thermoprotei archaeon]RLE98324.1 MAG: glycine cleavage system aminomethyltransferase GcvT [Thermoprotei archaeon]HDI74588.1 glycine cleavage system aminomethyltransferase GcvT [Thermoprotei archaeon]
MASLKTPLYEEHVKLGATISDFAGWSMPIVYESTIKEHLSVRKSAGIFDVSHMARILVKGADSAKLLQKLIAKNIEKAKEGRMLGPTAFLNEQGGFIDDIMVYKLSEKEYLIVGNAVNREKDFSWIKRFTEGLEVKVADITFDIAMIALQGPDSSKIMKKLSTSDIMDLDFLHFKKEIEVAGVKSFLVSRSGWTGEDGYEIMIPSDSASKIWSALIKAGATPCGLAARDSLRIEMGYCLYGEDIDENTTPLEARYWVFTFNKPPYIGYDALLKKYEEGVDRIRLGIKLKERVVPRRGCKIYMGEKCIGEITSGTYSPVLNCGIGIAYIDSRHALVGAPVVVDIRGKKRKAKIVDFPFITK